MDLTFETDEPMTPKTKDTPPPVSENGPTPRSLLGAVAQNLPESPSRELYGFLTALTEESENLVKQTESMNTLLTQVSKNQAKLDQNQGKLQQSLKYQLPLVTNHLTYIQRNIGEIKATINSQKAYYLDLKNDIADLLNRVSKLEPTPTKASTYTRGKLGMVGGVAALAFGAFKFGDKAKVQQIAQQAAGFVRNHNHHMAMPSKRAAAAATLAVATTALVGVTVCVKKMKAHLAKKAESSQATQEMSTGTEMSTTSSNKKVKFNLPFRDKINGVVERFVGSAAALAGAAWLGKNSVVKHGGWKSAQCCQVAWTSCNRVSGSNNCFSWCYYLREKNESASC
jgi:hypothetical protein